MEGKKGSVCVTGGEGFIGSWLIKTFLHHGYSVSATVRSTSENEMDLSFLTSLPGASEKLKILKADLEEPESFTPAIEGCVGVFHVATPVDFEDNEPEEVVTKRSVDGALSILRACSGSKTVKRLVYTSSGSAVVAGHLEAPDVMDESSWSNVDRLRALKFPGSSYMIMKTLTEKSVLGFSQNEGLEVVTLIPSFVVGPFICPNIPSSVQFIMNTILGAGKLRVPSSLTLGSVTSMDLTHVDDIARAHIFIFEHSEANGRYICSSETAKVKILSELLSSKHPELHIDITCSLNDTENRSLPALSSKKLVDLGFEFKHNIGETLDDAIRCCREKGYL